MSDAGPDIPLTLGRVLVTGDMPLVSMHASVISAAAHDVHDRDWRPCGRDKSPRLATQQALYGNSTATDEARKTKKSAGVNLLTLVILGSPTWARTRDLRINSHIRKVEESVLSC